MKNIRMFGLFILLAAFLVACGSATPASEPATRFEPYPEETQILALTNAFRAQPQTCGTQQFPAAPVVTHLEAVGDTAWYHSRDMATQDTVNHVGASTVDRLIAQGFTPGLTVEHRNKTSLPVNPEDAFNAWAADPASCANIMNPAFTIMGAGYSGHHEGFANAYWTQILTTPQTTTVQPTLSLNPTTATVTVGGAAVTINATLANATDTINWVLTGAGTLSATTGATTTYTPPTEGGASTATLTATAGALTASATITINEAAPAPVGNEEAFLALINAFRAQPQTCAGEAMPAVPPVSLNAILNTASQLHSQDMADNNYFSHTGLNGSTFTSRATAQGYTGFAAGENIAAGNSTAQGAFDQWRTSQTGHCQFMMSAAIDEIGIGYGQNAASDFTHYWTLKGGKKAVATPTLSLTPTTSTVTVGDAAIPFTATLTNSADTINWALTGAGTLSATTGATVSYTPPADGGASTATLTATAGALTESATITINAAAPAPVPSLVLTPTTPTVTVGGAAIPFTATLTNSADTINWALTGAGTLSGTTGATVSYTPPADGGASTATLTATAGALTATATITINAAAAPPVGNEEAFLALINAFRAQPQTCAGEAMPAVPPVSLNAILNTASQLHSQDMADNNYFSHTGLNGSTFTSRAEAQGYTGFAAGENIAAGSSTPQGAFDQWRTSQTGHCQFMMSANINEIGIGYGQNAASDFTHYWTLKGGRQ